MTKTTKWVRWVSLPRPEAWLWATREEAERVAIHSTWTLCRITIEAVEEVTPKPEPVRVTLIYGTWERASNGIDWSKTSGAERPVESPILSAALDRIATLEAER